MQKLIEEIIKAGYLYRDNGEGSYDIEYHGYTLTVSEDEDIWIFNYIKTPEGKILSDSEEEDYDESFLMSADTGTSYYPKNGYTLESALEDLTNR